MIHKLLLPVNNTTKKVLVIILFALLIRVNILAHSSFTFYSDDAIYASLARLLTEGNLAQFFHPTWQPFYPALSAIIYKLVGNWESALRLVSVISGVAIIIPLFFLVRKFLSSAHALVFTASITFFIPVFKISLLPISDMLSTLLILTALTQTVVGLNQERRMEPLVLSSFFFGLAYLTRSEGTMFFFLTFTWAAFMLIYQILLQKAEIKNLLILPAMMGVFFLTISPYLISTRVQLGRWTISHKFSAQIKQGHAFQLRSSGTTWSQEVVSVRSPKYNSKYFSGGLEHIMTNQNLFVWLFKQKVKGWTNLLKELFPTWAIPVMLLGALWGFCKKPWTTIYLAIITITAIPATIFSTPLVDPRYLLWSFPILLILFYLGTKAILSLLQSSEKTTAAATLLLTLTFPSFGLTTIISPTTYAREFTQIHTRQEIKKAGEWIKLNSKQEVPRILMRHEGVEFYANGETVYIPQDLGYEELIAYARGKNSDYLVFWTEELSADKKLSELLEEGEKFSDIEEAVRFKQDNRVIVIYVFRD